MLVFCAVKSLGLVSTNVSEEHTASIFSPEDGSSMFHGNVVSVYNSTKWCNLEVQNRHLHQRENLK
jgi:hypothetical protein